MAAGPFAEHAWTPEVESDCEHATKKSRRGISGFFRRYGLEIKIRRSSRPNRNLEGVPALASAFAGPGSFLHHPDIAVEHRIPVALKLDGAGSGRLRLAAASGSVDLNPVVDKHSVVLHRGDGIF